MSSESLATGDIDIGQKTTEQQNNTEPDFTYYKSPLAYLPNEILSYIFILGRSSSCYVFDCPRIHEPPYQHIVSHVCSKWRRIALDTGQLWTDVAMRWFSNRIIFIYNTWVSRAGGYPINVTLDFDPSRGHLYVHKILQDIVMPYRVKKLDIKLSHRQLSDSGLSGLDLNIEELAVTLTDFPDGDFIAPPFYSRTRSILFKNAYHRWNFNIPLNALHIPWHELRVLKCPSGAPFSSWLDVLHQAQLLEECHLTICGTGTGIDDLKAVTLPNLCSFVIEFRQVHPDIVIPFISAPKATILEIKSTHAWSADTYNIIKKQYKLNQLQRIELRPTGGFALRVAEVLKDAPVIYDLLLGGKPILDDETREKIASGQLGRFLTQFTLRGCGNNTKEWLDMVEARQKNVCTLLQTVTNWFNFAMLENLTCIWKERLL